jgi:hypothetical protein
MSRFSRNRSPSPHASAAHVCAAADYGYVTPVELPGEREECELPAQSITGPDQQMHRYAHASVDAMAWQRHHPLDWTSGSPTNVDYAFDISQISPRPFISVDTSVEMVRASPWRVGAHYISPSNNHSHNYRAVDVAGTALQTPQPTLCLSSFHMSPSASVTPAHSVISNTRESHGAEHATYMMEVAKGPLRYDYEFLNDRYDSFADRQYPDVPIVSPVSPITRHDDDSVLRDHVSHDLLDTATVHSEFRFQHLLGGSERLPQSLDAQQNLSSLQDLQYGHARPAKNLLQSAQRRFSTSEKYSNGISSHTLPESKWDESVSQQAPCSSSFNLDEALPTYDGSRNVTILVENQIVQEVQEPPQPLHQQSKVKQAAATAARAIMNLLPLACIYCGKQFHGRYQRANRNRHVNSFHVDVDLAAVAGIDDGKCCRTCCQRFRRTDARRKHEWKKHRTEDCRPNKRRIEKRGGERRIYMPPISDERENCG